MSIAAVHVIYLTTKTYAVPALGVFDCLLAGARPLFLLPVDCRALAVETASLFSTSLLAMLASGVAVPGRDVLVCFGALFGTDRAISDCGDGAFRIVFPLPNNCED